MLRNLSGDNRRLFNLKTRNLVPETVSKKSLKLDTWDDRTKPSPKVLKTVFWVQKVLEASIELA